MEDQNLLTQPMEQPKARKCCSGGCGCQQTGAGVPDWMGMSIAIALGFGTLLAIGMAVGLF